MSRNLSILFTVFLALVSGLIFAGEEYTLKELQNKYKEEHAIYLSESEHVYIKTNGNEYEIYNDVSWEMMYLTDKAKAYGNQSINFSKFSEIQDIKAFAYLPKSGDPTKLKKEKVTDFKTEDVYDGSYFFHDNKQIAFTYPGTEPGTKIKLSYREVVKNPKFMGSTFLVSFIPTLKSEYHITYPSNVEVNFKLFNVENIDVKHTKIVKGDYTTLSWIVENQDPYESVSGAPSIRYYAPHIIAYIETIKLQDSTVKVLPNLSGLYDWYYSLVKDVNVKEDSSLKAITELLVKGVESKDEKARLIFNWVQDNIKYIAFEDGMGGFIPRPAARVCRNRYGDCKDMASIITDMMRYAGEDASITWVGSRALPYDYTEVPTPAVDNHMIASYRNEKNEVVILDAVGTYTPYGYPTEFIQGKQVLISKGEGNYEVYRIPPVEKERNAENDYILMRLKNGKLVGEGRIETRGYAKINYVHRLINMSNDEDKREYIESRLEKGSNKFRIEESQFYGVSNRDTSLTINYKFNLEDYSKTVGDETYVNLNLDRDFKNDLLEIEERKGVGVEFEYQFNDYNEVAFEIPKGSHATYVPPNTDVQEEAFGFSIKYEKEDGKIILKKQIYVDVLMVEEAQFEAWNKMIKKLNKAYQEVLVIVNQK